MLIDSFVSKKKVDNKKPLRYTYTVIYINFSTVVVT
jgi:hypothetical protein